MTSAIIAISILKQSSMSQKQLTNFLFYLSQEALKEYLANIDICKGKRRLSKNELIEMIITEKPITITHFNRDEEMTKEQAIDLPCNNGCMKKKLHIYAKRYYRQRCGNLNTKMIYVLSKIIKELKRYVQTLIDSLKIVTKKKLKIFLLHLTIIKRKHACTLINTYYIDTFNLVFLWR